MKYPRALALLPLLLACSRPGHELTASLVGSSEIRLAWRSTSPETAGYWVEFTTPGADFVKLEVAWPDAPSFRHTDLAGATRYIYRVIPFFGRVSPAATLRTGTSAGEDAPMLPEGPLDDAPARGKEQRSLRSPATIADAAPAALSVHLPSPTSAELRWTDRASDEGGYLVELAKGAGPFQVVALLPPDARSFRKVGLPPDTELRVRVRAFYEGPPSNQAAATTPPDGR